MNAQGKKSHPIRKTLFWLFFLVFIGSIAVMFVSSNSNSMPAPSHVRVRSPAGHNAPLQNLPSSPTSLATLTAVISAVGTLSTMVLAWLQFLLGRKSGSDGE